jgi:hypothetical protein
MSENERRKIRSLLDPTQAEALAKRLDLVDRLRAVPPSDRFGRLAAEAADALEHSWEVGRHMLDEIGRLNRLRPEPAGPSSPARSGVRKTEAADKETAAREAPTAKPKGRRSIKIEHLNAENDG